MQLDTTDLRILQVLQEDGRISNQDLAERVALSPSACLRRVRMLEEGGAITGYRAQLGRAALGLELEAIVQVSMRQDVTGWHETFMAAVQSWPEIVAAYIITGDCNYILPGVMDIRSNIVLRTIKDREGGLALLMESRGVRPLEGGKGGAGAAKRPKGTS